MSSNEENPGVSQNQTFFTTWISVCLVVCLPRFNAVDISFVLRFNSGDILFSIVVFPAPVWPVKTTIESCKNFIKSSNSVLEKQGMPIFS